jgi:hypothetical protein
VPAATALQVHEFAHHIHLVALTYCESNANTVAYKNANASRSYSPESYMISDEFEYLAEATHARFQVSCAQQQLLHQSRAASAARQPAKFPAFKGGLQQPAMHASGKVMRTVGG